MLYFKIDGDSNVIEISEDGKKVSAEQNWAIGYTDEKLTLPFIKSDGGWLCRADIDAFFYPYAEKLAESASKLTGDKYLATDEGEWCSPRYDVIRAFAVGDDVSKGFNGDYYPMGKIVKISDDFKRIHVDGPRGKAVFYRRKLSGSWKLKGMWFLVLGTHSEWNKEF